MSTYRNSAELVKLLTDIPYGNPRVVAADRTLKKALFSNDFIHGRISVLMTDSTQMAGYKHTFHDQSTNNNGLKTIRMALAGETMDVTVRFHDKSVSIF
jgi:hypothetical protein